MINELLCPCGNFEAVKVAITFGADAIYLAGKKFGARSFIDNLTNEEIVEASKYTHLYGKKIYVTLNTFIFEDEFEEVKDYIAFLYENVDGVIVQDYGVIHYIRMTYPDFPVHVSTQLSIANINDLLFLKSIGVSRIVLARETPIEDIKKMLKVGIELEVFIHGALCFSYSGLCYLSYYRGGRSGNRGSCAQPCRETYTLLEDGEEIATDSFLSMKDLNTIDYLRSLLEIGVTSLKIEGRAKSLEYLASVTRIYRQLIDQFNDHKKMEVSPQYYDDLYASFSRETTKGYIFNESNKEVTTDDSPRHRGLFIGRVIATYEKQVKIKLNKELNMGDGIRILGENTECGLTVTRIIEKGKMVNSSSSEVIIDINGKIKVGDWVFKTSSNKLKNEIKNTKNSIKNHAKIKILINNYKQVLEISVNDIAVKEVVFNQLDKINSDIHDNIKKQFMKVNNLPIEYRDIIYENNDYYLPISLINEMRSKCLEKLKYALSNRKERHHIPYPFIDNNFIIEKPFDELDIDELKIDNSLINNDSLEKAKYAYHIGEIDIDSTLSPYFGVNNHYAISFFRNLTKGVIILSYESSASNAKELSRFDKCLGYLINYRAPLMVSKHCIVSKSKGYDVKGCGECLKHQYQLKDGKHIYDLYFHKCVMQIKGEGIIRSPIKELISVRIK